LDLGVVEQRRERRGYVFTVPDAREILRADVHHRPLRRYGNGQCGDEQSKWE
jgi:hypothetical protein